MSLWPNAEGTGTRVLEAQTRVFNLAQQAILSMTHPDQPYNTLWSICFLENFVLVFGVNVFCFVLKQGLKKA